jgi:hypothetical protein
VAIRGRLELIVKLGIRSVWLVHFLLQYAVGSSQTAHNYDDANKAHEAVIGRKKVLKCFHVQVLVVNLERFNGTTMPHDFGWKHDKNQSSRYFVSTNKGRLARYLTCIAIGNAAVQSISIITQCGPGYRPQPSVPWWIWLAF